MSSISQSQCAHCGAHIPDHLQSPRKKFCSKTCHSAAMRRFVACTICGTAFRPRRKDAKFCSKACMAVAFRQLPDQSCAHCGTMFRPARKANTYCSTECAAAAVRQHIPQECHCEECGAAFISDQSRRNRFCSMACYRSMQERNKRWYERACLHCGTLFTTTRPDKVYCDSSCANADHSSGLERRVGTSLRARGVIVEHQYRLQGFFYDYAVHAARLLVEVDGDYWHSFPERKQRDRVKTAVALSLGWRLMRVTESDLAADWAATIDRIVQAAQ